jgi:transposase InsO family protein
MLLQQHIKYRFTRSYTPRTNGKAERFIQTSLREWAYARTYQTSLDRHQQLDPWIHVYNFHASMLASTTTHQPHAQA